LNKDDEKGTPNHIHLSAYTKQYMATMSAKGTKINNVEALAHVKANIKDFH